MNKTATVHSDLSVIALNVNELNSPMKRHGVIKWIRKPKRFRNMVSIRDFSYKDIHRLKMKG